MVERLGTTSEAIMRIFNEVDPLHCFYGNNVDEYVGYAERIFSRLGDRKFSDINDQDIAALVRSSFHASQIEQGFLDERDLEVLTQKIIQLRDNPSH